jgi:D-glycero-D-manno-heptose 1,7-bisphosphate phosphatase
MPLKLIQPKPALFLDRDGVINIEKNYLYKKEDFEFIEGIFDVCQVFQDRGFNIFVVTNQSGIARGYYTNEDFDVLTQWMCERFLQKSITIQKVYHCPHHPDISGSCECRKPKPGMLRQADEEFGVDFEHSVLIGDSERDIEAAHAVGIEETYLYSTEEKESSAKYQLRTLKEMMG